MPLVETALRFLADFHAETGAPGLAARSTEVTAEIERTGTYTHTMSELAWGAKVAWRNAARCIGRLYWHNLNIRDCRKLRDPDDVARACFAHLRDTWRGGQIRPTITVFAPDHPTEGAPLRIWNDQLIRYAGYREADDSVLGDGRYVEFTRVAQEHGWRGKGTAFDVLPLLIEAPSGISMHPLPADTIAEVEISHPDYEWFVELGLRWHAIPALSNMRLEIGGVSYGAAPFNGWYLQTEIAARNLVDADRYDALPAIGHRLGLDLCSERTLWRDRALVELNRAVIHSFDQAGVTIADHHTESTRFLRHLAREESSGRVCRADWSWIVPPISGGLTSVYHRYYPAPDPTARPAFLTDEAAVARGLGRGPGIAEPVAKVPQQRRCPNGESRSNDHV